MIGSSKLRARPAFSRLVSLVRDAGKRKIVFDLAQVASALDAAGNNDAHAAHHPPNAVQPAATVGGAVAR
jgi:hypothetical protein